MKTLDVYLNGTDTNPWHDYGLVQNPFPQIAEAEHVGACLRLQSLGGNPIPHDRYEEYIRERLEGFTEEFIKCCIDRFVPGKLIKFTVKWGK